MMLSESYPGAEEQTAQLAHLREINSKLVMLMAHELGTPLTHVLAYLRLWQERAPVAEQPEVDLAVQQALTLKARLDDVLLLDQLETGVCVLQMRATPIQEVILRVVENQRWRLQEKGIMLSVQADCQQRVYADKELLVRALDHLIANAAKFSRRRGMVELRTTCQDGFCRIVVTDHGIGMPPEKLRQIFEPFFQIDSTRARRYPGLGIGLGVVRAIIEKHGGSVLVESEMGCGSTFTVTVPLA